MSAAIRVVLTENAFKMVEAAMVRALREGKREAEKPLERLRSERTVEVQPGAMTGWYVEPISKLMIDPDMVESTQH